MKFKILYNTIIASKPYKAGDEIEFAEGTDELFIKRLIDIKCIEALPAETDTKKGEHKRKRYKKDEDDSSSDEVDSKSQEPEIDISEA
ncbi:MAG: hypothetical protein ACTTH5_00045 [Wolinella sp.]